MEKRTEQTEITLITATTTGEYKLLTEIPKLKAKKVYDPEDFPEMEPIIEEFGDYIDSVWVGTPPVAELEVHLSFLGHCVMEKIERASGDDELMDYIPDLISQYFQVLHQVQGIIDVQPYIDTIGAAVEIRELEEYVYHENFQDYMRETRQARVIYQVVKMLENKN